MGGGVGGVVQYVEGSKRSRMERKEKGTDRKDVKEKEKEMKRKRDRGNVGNWMEGKWNDVEKERCGREGSGKMWRGERESVEVGGEIGSKGAGEESGGEIRRKRRKCNGKETRWEDW